MSEPPATTDAPAPPTVIYNGAGVVAEEPTIQQAPPQTVTLPTTSRRRLVESLVLFVSTILFLRAVTVEPFGVPTGSMAPTLCGNHKALSCPRCGYPIRVGEPGSKTGDYPEAHCPNCGANNLAIDAAPEIAGDRLLVDKNVFRIRSPRRWEVGVFICPSDKSKPYVKRVAGRPGEKIQIRDGDVWINGELARKTLAQARECRVPMFDADYAPPGGWRCRWLPEGTRPVIRAVEPAPPPEWLTFDGSDLVIAGEGSTSPRLTTYWNVSLDSKTAEVIGDGFEYNGHTSPTHDYAVHDFFVECDTEVQAGTGNLVISLTDGADAAIAQLAVGGEFGESKLLRGSSSARITDGGMVSHLTVEPSTNQLRTGLLKTANRPPLKFGKTYRVEMAFVDRRVSVAVDGHEYFSFDFPPTDMRPDVTSPFRLGAEGATIAFRHIKLYRDVYYRPSDRHAGSEPYQLGPDEYFLLGDNSANSDDSRSWQIPGVPERNFLGKPFLLHQPSRPAQWGVAGRRVDAQAIDWDRIRWLR